MLDLDAKAFRSSLRGCLAPPPAQSMQLCVHGRAINRVVGIFAPQALGCYPGRPDFRTNSRPNYLCSLCEVSKPFGQYGSARKTDAGWPRIEAAWIG